MKTVIVLANRVSESEKLKSLASFGESVFDVRYMASLDLAEYLLQLSGVAYPQTFIKNDLLSASLYTKIKEIDYFKQFTYNDILGLIETLQDVRYHIVADEAKTIHAQLGTVKAFKKKNEAILQVYDLLQEFLQTSGCIDEAGVVRFTLENTRSFPDIEFIRYEKSHLRPLEMALLDKAAGKAVGETKICAEDKPLVIKSYLKAFGQSNEIEDILSYIYKNGIHFDDCLIASADGNNYANILSSYRDLLGFPLTLGVGRPLSLSSPGRLFSCLLDWRDHHYRGEYLSKILHCPSFDIERFQKDIGFPENMDALNVGLPKQYRVGFDLALSIVGELKISFDKATNEQRYQAYEALVKRYGEEKPEEIETLYRLRSLPYVKKVIDIFDKGEREFLDAYSLRKEKKADEYALAKTDKLLSFESLGVSRLDIEKMIDLQSVSRESLQPGSLYFTSISRASSCLRKHLFLVGMSSNLFPGKNVENPPFLDEDYAAFGVKEASTRGIRENKEDYFALLEEAKHLGVDIHLSWSCYNEETLKGQNPSSVVFETYQLEKGKDKTIADFEKEFKENPTKFRYVEYFEHSLLPIDPVGKASSENVDIAFAPVEERDEDRDVPVKRLLEEGKAFSASAITNYAKCPYLFFLKNVLGMAQEKEIDVSEVIPADAYGNLAHELLEGLSKKEQSKQDFLEKAASRFDDYLVFHPSETTALALLAKREFLEMMGNAYDMEGTSPVMTAEKDFYFTHQESGVRIHGLPDKVIQLDNGNVQVIDYKTGRRVSHDVDDPADMAQCAVYAYLYEHCKKGAKVDGFEYRYIRLGERVFSSDNGHSMQDHYEALTAILLRLKQSLETGSFDPDLSRCDSCYMKDLCRKRKGNR